MLKVSFGLGSELWAGLEGIEDWSERFLCGWFDEVGADSEGAGSVLIFGFSGACENDDGDGEKLRLFSKPCEELETVHVGELEIEKNDGRKRKALAV